MAFDEVLLVEGGGGYEGQAGLGTGGEGVWRKKNIPSFCLPGVPW